MRLSTIVDRVKVSVIIVSWNTRKLLRDCLTSVYGAPGTVAFEVIVIDNGSSDGSADMVASDFRGVRLLKNAKNRGFAAATNQGLKLARGRYALLLNSDTVLLGDVLAKSVEYMDQHACVAAMGCRVLNQDFTVQLTCQGYPSLLNMVIAASGLSRLRWPKLFGREQMRGWLRDTTRDVDIVSGCFMLTRTDAVAEVGLLDESFFFCGEEADWCKRFRASGWAIRFAPVGEIIHLGNASGQLHQFRRDLMLSEGMIRFLRKHHGVIAAIVAWIILLYFNAARACFWAVAAACTRTLAAYARRDHFVAVTCRFGAAWPSAVKTRTTRESCDFS